MDLFFTEDKCTSWKKRNRKIWIKDFHHRSDGLMTQMMFHQLLHRIICGKLSGINRHIYTDNQYVLCTNSHRFAIVKIRFAFAFKQKRRKREEKKKWLKSIVMFVNIANSSYGWEDGKKKQKGEHFEIDILTMWFQSESRKSQHWRLPFMHQMSNRQISIFTQTQNWLSTPNVSRFI